MQPHRGAIAIFLSKMDITLAEINLLTSPLIPTQMKLLKTHTNFVGNGLSSDHTSGPLTFLTCVEGLTLNCGNEYEKKKKKKKKMKKCFEECVE